MPRKLVKRVSSDVPKNLLDSFLGPKKAVKKRSPGARRNQYIEEVRRRMKVGDWRGMTAGKLAALYWLCHERVYGVIPYELKTAAAFERAMKSAGLMVKSQFDGDVQKAVVFLRWTWTEEQRKEDWRRRNRRHGRRISWQNQFVHDYLITEWRIAAMRSRQ